MMMALHCGSQQDLLRKTTQSEPLPLINVIFKTIVQILDCKGTTIVKKYFDLNKFNIQLKNKEAQKLWGHYDIGV